MRIKEVIDEYAKNNASRFHTPGHSGSCNPFIENLKGIFPFDVTELPQLGSLYDIDTPIQNSERLMADLYGADGCIFSAGGATQSIKTMILTAVGYGGSMVVSRNVHTSVINTIALLSITPVWYYPTPDGTPVGHYDPDVLDELLKKHPQVSAVLVNTPDYYGFISDVAAISRITKKYTVKLLVDNSHGSHLKFCSDLHPISCGADFCVDSLHKTLPVLTGGAALFFSGDQNIVELKKNSALFGSTSPSFLILYSIDCCIDYLVEKGSASFTALSKKVAELKSEFSSFIPFNFVSDPCRLTLKFSGVSKDFLKDYFLSLNVYYEFICGDVVVFILTPFTSDRDFKRLSLALKNFPKNRLKQGDISSYNFTPVETVLPISDALFAETKTVSLEHALDQICAADCSVYPPGTSAIMPGEKLNRQIINILKIGGTSYVKVVKLK